MSVGLTVTKSQVDAEAGNIAYEMHSLMRRVEVFKRWLDATPDEDLTGLGYASGDIANLRSAFNDAAELQSVFIGDASVDTPKDFRTFLRRLAGLTS